MERPQRKRIGKENVEAASRRGVSRPSATTCLSFLLSPCLATNHTRSSLISARLFIHLHPSAPFDVFTPPKSFNYRSAPFVTACATARERSDSVIVDPALSMVEDV